MGALSYGIQLGIPREVLVPLLPVDQGFGGKGHGKAPAKFDPSTGRWGALDDWQRGGHDPATVLRDADAAGGNAGLILGAIAGSFQFLAIDIDLNDGPKAVKWRNGILHLFQRAMNQTLLVRESWPYRALLLVNIPVAVDPGPKKIFTLSYADPNVPGSAPEEIGKLELLARGQQAAIAGTHISGNRMMWFRQGEGGPGNERHPAPPVADGLPGFASYDDVAAAIVAVLGMMADAGFSYSMLSATVSDGPAPAITDLAAPSAGELATLLDQTPNPRAVDRDLYASFLLAISGARAGLVAVQGALSQAEEDLIANAVAGWASRWSAPPGHTAGTFDEERAKWIDDWVRPREQNYAGWRRVMENAQAFGAPASALTDFAMQAAQNQFTADLSQPPPADEVQVPASAGGFPQTPVASDRSPAWTMRLQRTAPPKGALEGKPLANQFNAYTALHFSPEFEGTLLWDAFASRVVVAACPPWIRWSPERKSAWRPRELQDSDVAWIRIWLNENDIHVPKEIIRDAILQEAEENKFHPVRDYLGSLQWDGRPRIDRWLIDHLGAEDTPLNRAIGRKWLIGGVARVETPGCKVDTLLSLEGTQGIGKSRALAVLAGDWFCDHLPDLSGKDCLMQIQGRWIIEIAELDAFRRAENSRLKAFLSTSTDRFRAPYAMTTQDYPRQCILAATSNPDGNGHLHDPTGARRMWTVACAVAWPKERKADMSAFAAVRNQLWAEARAAFLAGETWWLDNHEIETAQAEAAEERFDHDAWTDRIAEFVRGRAEVTTAEIMAECIYPTSPIGKWTRSDETRVGNVMRELQWAATRPRGDATRKRVYLNPGPWPGQEVKAETAPEDQTGGPTL